jgi:hypothetical protein
MLTATVRGREAPELLHKKAPEMGAFFMEITSHQLGKIEPGIRFFLFYYVHSKQMMKRL